MPCVCVRVPFLCWSPFTCSTGRPPEVLCVPKLAREVDAAGSGSHTQGDTPRQATKTCAGSARAVFPGACQCSLQVSLPVRVPQQVEQPSAAAAATCTMPGINMHALDAFAAMCGTCGCRYHCALRPLAASAARPKSAPRAPAGILATPTQCLHAGETTGPGRPPISAMWSSPRTFRGTRPLAVAPRWRPSPVGAPCTLNPR